MHILFTHKSKIHKTYSCVYQNQYRLHTTGRVSYILSSLETHIEKSSCISVLIARYSAFIIINQLHIDDQTYHIKVNALKFKVGMKCKVQTSNHEFKEQNLNQLHVQENAIYIFCRAYNYMHTTRYQCSALGLTNRDYTNKITIHLKNKSNIEPRPSPLPLTLAEMG